MTILKDFISETAFAQQIGRHPATVERWRKYGLGPPFVILGKTPRSAPSPNGSPSKNKPLAFPPKPSASPGICKPAAP